MMPSGNTLPFTRHADVMHATPTDEESVVRLVEELKRRGNAAFQHKSYEEAEALYSKAVEVNGSNPGGNQHVFFANRAAARCQMGKPEQALADADACIALDHSYAKGHFRKAQALKILKRYREAIRAIGVAKQLEPDNKSAVKLLAELQELAKKHVETPVVPAPDRVVTRVEVAEEAQQQQQRAAASATTEKVTVDAEEVEGQVRGYKKLADGRVTTYFHNELTDEERRLIGDIAPKKVEDPNIVQIKSVEGGSAWNQGNTFEEKDMLAWGRTELEKLLTGIRAPLSRDDNASSVVVEVVKDISGIVSIAVVRGSKRYIYDLSFTLGCKAELTDGTTLTGDLQFLEMSSDSDGEYELQAVVPARYESAAGKALHAALTTSASPFRQLVASQLATFVTAFHNH